MSPRQRALDILALTDPKEKAAQARSLHTQCAGQDIDWSASALLQPAAPLPGRPERPALVPPDTVPRRSPFTPEGRAALLHAIAHIEFNAIKTTLHVSISQHEINVCLGPTSVHHVLGPFQRVTFFVLFVISAS